MRVNDLENDLPEILVIREGLLSIQICTTIPPRKMSDIPSRLSNPGTSHGSWELPDFEKHPESKPIECKEIGGALALRFSLLEREVKNNVHK
jgi:hypothetical protein